MLQSYSKRILYSRPKCCPDDVPAVGVDVGVYIEIQGFIGARIGLFGSLFLEIAPCLTAGSTTWVATPLYSRLPLFYPDQRKKMAYRIYRRKKRAHILFVLGCLFFIFYFFSSLLVAFVFCFCCCCCFSFSSYFLSEPNFPVLADLSAASRPFRRCTFTARRREGAVTAGM